MADTFWANFGVNNDLYKVTCEGQTGSLAVDIAEYFGLEVKSTSRSIGGPLKDIDIKHMDAIPLMKMSLLEESADNIIQPYEIFVDYESNAIEFRKIGYDRGRITDIYHTIQTSSYVEKCSGVLVTGRDPLPYRKDTLWAPIWGDNKDYIHVYDTTAMISNCNREKFSQQATIAFRDPHLNTQYADGIDNFYDMENPYEKLQGYAIQRGSTSGFMTPDVTIIDSNRALIPIKLTDDTKQPKIGNLFKPPTVNTEIYSADCWTEVAEAPSNALAYGIEIPVPSEFRFSTMYGEAIDNFVDVVKVYVIGVELTECMGHAVTDKKGLEDSSDENTDIWVDGPNTNPQVFGMQYGLQYVIGYDKAANPKMPRLIFADGSYDTDKAKYGYECKFNIRPTSPIAKGMKTLTNIKGTILPIDGTTGIWVQEVWAIVELNCPSVTITDPKGKASDIANQMFYNLKPLVTVDPPPPVAFNGTIVDQSIGVRDSDPTTTQNFEDTPYELIMDKMDKGGGLNVHLSFLSEDQCVNLSRSIYDHMNSGNGIETVWVCGPECEPVLGGYGNANGVVNSISYQYSDRGSYIISVTEGQTMHGNLGSITGAAGIKEVESRSAQGNIVGDLGNGIFYKVRVDGFGDYKAYNISQDILRIGDVVQVTLHNLPVED